MAAGADIPFACRCGSVTGILHDVRPSEGTHALCQCNSCRRGLELFDMGALAAGGVEIFQTTPDRIEFLTGLDQMAVMSLSPKGMLRWHARCCGTPMVNTFRSPAMPFAGVLVHSLADSDPLGPVVATGFIPGPGGKQRHQHLHRVIWRMLKRTLAAKISGRARTNPFFDSAGQPIATPDLAPRP